MPSGINKCHWVSISVVIFDNHFLRRYLTPCYYIKNRPFFTLQDKMWGLIEFFYEKIMGNVIVLKK